ncbi:MAG: MotA/TolQ/ExbB proton channel family protein [Mariprofundaceae bacterium]|nr:MotA/TolQ/ExbB proton channel family protein [Mariprofundaceae bacterium]
MSRKNTMQRAADQRALRTFALWMGWAVSSLAVFAMLYRKANVMEFVQHDTTRITWIILGMFVLGVAISFMQAMRLTTEWFRAYKIEAMVKKNGIAGVTMRGGKHIVDRFTDALRLISERNGRLDVESLVDVEFSSQHRTSQFTGLLGNLMITLGLIGTVLGMTITMNGLQGALGSLGINQDLLVDGLRTAMSGMGVAFYTTLMGSVLGGVLLRVFAWITDASVNGLQDLMVRTYLVYASADLEPSDERDIRALDASVTHLNERMEMLNLAMRASRKEMQGLRADALGMHEQLKGLAVDDPVPGLTASHARYALSVRPGMLNRMFARFRS